MEFLEKLGELPMEFHLIAFVCFIYFFGVETGLQVFEKHEIH